MSRWYQDENGEDVFDGDIEGAEVFTVDEVLTGWRCHLKDFHNVPFPASDGCSVMAIVNAHQLDHYALMSDDSLGPDNVRPDSLQVVIPLHGHGEL